MLKKCQLWTIKLTKVIETYKHQNLFCSKNACCHYRLIYNFHIIIVVFQPDMFALYVPFNPTRLWVLRYSLFLCLFLSQNPLTAMMTAVTLLSRAPLTKCSPHSHHDQCAAQAHMYLYTHINIFIFIWGSEHEKVQQMIRSYFLTKKWQMTKNFFSFLLFFFCMWNAWVCVSNNSIASWRTGHTNLALTWELRLENVWASHFS